MSGLNSEDLISEKIKIRIKMNQAESINFSAKISESSGFNENKKYLDFFDIQTVNSVVNNTKNTDDAFISSILSYSVYDKNNWIYESLGKTFEEMKPKFSEAFLNEDIEKSQELFFDLKIWHHMNNLFEKIKPNEITIPTQNMELTGYAYVSEYSYQDGRFYSKNIGQQFDIAHANLIKRKNPNGEGYILHLTYRGTEFNHIWKYLTGPYLDMSAYYENFKPLEKYIKDYVSDPKNNIDELHVAGHSLGGSMVQQFLKNNSEEDFPIPIKGFTFGSPGSQKNKFMKFITTAYHSILRGVEVPIEENSKKDKRLKEFSHNNDPIPKIGLLGYKRNGETQNLLDIVNLEYRMAKKIKSFSKKSILDKIPIFSKMYKDTKHFITSKFLLNYHDSSRYIKNIRNLMEDCFLSYPNIGNLLSENMPNLKSWSNNERKFLYLSIKHREQFIEMLKEKHPTHDEKSLHNMIYKMREKMLLDTTSEATLAKTGYYNGRPDNFLRDKSPKELEELKVLDKNMVLEARNALRVKLPRASLKYNPG